MELKNILAVSGKPGLYRLISSNTARLVVESIQDKKKLPIPATSKVSSLEDIAIFTYDNEVPLSEVFAKMFEKTGQAEGPSHKSPAEELRAYIGDVLDGIDHDRVYDSDLKKLFNWYNILFSDGFFSAVADDGSQDNNEVEQEQEESKED